MLERERNPKDPRNNPRHREHGARRFTHTWADIALVLGCSEKRAQNMAALRLFDPKSIASVVAERDRRAARRAGRARAVTPRS